MKFKLLEIDYKEFPFKKNALQRTWKLFSKQEETVSLFNWTKIHPNTYHIVFHIPDEHVSRTRKGSFEWTVPFSQYINAFLVNGLFFLEYYNNSYTNLIKEFIEEEYDVIPKPVKLNNTKTLSILKNTNSFIKKVELIDKEGEEFERNSLQYEDIDNLAQTNEISFTTFLHNSTFLSLNKEKSILSVNSDVEEEIVEIIEVITDAVKSSPVS